jgi:hypothetical protein
MIGDMCRRNKARPRNHKTNVSLEKMFDFEEFMMTFLGLFSSGIGAHDARIIHLQNSSVT